jgi:hypothetical protein
VSKRVGSIYRRGRAEKHAFAESMLSLTAWDGANDQGVRVCCYCRFPDANRPRFWRPGRMLPEKKGPPGPCRRSARCNPTIIQPRLAAWYKWVIVEVA